MYGYQWQNRVYGIVDPDFFITLMLHYNLFYLFIYFRKLAKLCSIWNKKKKKNAFTHYYKQVK